MKQDKSLKFLNACIEYLDNLDDSEIEKLEHIYEEEMERKCEETDFEILLPEERSPLVYEEKRVFSSYMSVEKKKNLDYKIQTGEESIGNSLETLAA